MQSYVHQSYVTGISASSEQVTLGGDDVEIGRIVCRAWRCVYHLPSNAREKIEGTFRYPDRLTI